MTIATLRAFHHESLILTAFNIYLVAYATVRKPHRDFRLSDLCKDMILWNNNCLCLPQAQAEWRRLQTMWPTLQKLCEAKWSFQATAQGHLIETIWSIWVDGTMWPPCMEVTLLTSAALKVHRPGVSPRSRYIQWELSGINWLSFPGGILDRRIQRALTSNIRQYQVR